MAAPENGQRSEQTMTTQTGIPVAVDRRSRRSGEDRRSEMDRRRTSKELFELRARREGLVSDRRRNPRRVEDGMKGRVRWYAFWRSDSDAVEE